MIMYATVDSTGLSWWLTISDIIVSQSAWCQYCIVY